jgi:hypothetical protein
MTTTAIRRTVVAIALAVFLPSISASAAWPDAAGPESRRMTRAKELIADEQWGRAIEELRAAAADPKEPRKDEALFWLAHSLNQENDFAAAVESIRRLEREHAASAWVKPARSLLIELAQKLKRDDVLWWTAVPSPGPGFGAVPGSTPSPRRPATPRPLAPVPATPPAAWIVDSWHPDIDQRIQALGSLLHSNQEFVVDLLRHIALDEKNAGAARRAVFVLAQSRKPAARLAVVEIAKRGPEPVRVAAVRELGRFDGPEVSQALLHVYSTANAPVKRQVVTSLGERSEAQALLRIAESESDLTLRATAITTLGRAGGRAQLVTLYAKADRRSKRPIIIGLFTARGDEELIRIAERERDRELRGEALARLRLLGTPKARAYLAKGDAAAR